MELIRGLENAAGSKPASVTVGSFDGLHLGHQRIFRQMREIGGGEVTVVTFDPHPQSIVRPNDPPPPHLTSFEERCKLFERYGVERLILAKFDLAFAALEAEEYVEKVLVDQLHATRLFVGPNHRFGKARRGDVNLLQALGIHFGFGVEVVEPVLRENEIVSSSRIRKRIIEGDVLTGFKLLSRPFYVSGMVVHGAGRGRDLGFPTANFAEWETNKIIPPPGIYATVTEVGSERFYSVSHFGPRPTFEGATPALETHLLDFDRDIYGSTIRVGIVDRLRDIEAFRSVDELIQQMNSDRDLARMSLIAAGYKGDSRTWERRIGSFGS